MSGLPGRPLTLAQKQKILALRRLVRSSPLLGRHVIAYDDDNSEVRRGEVTGYYQTTVAIKDQNGEFTWPADKCQVISVNT